MRRALMAVLAASAMAVLFTAPVGAKEFGMLYAEGEIYRTFGNPAQVEAGTGTDPLYKLVNSTNADQLAVAQFAPGEGSHGGRWAIWEATWVNEADRGILVTDYEALQGYVDAGRLTLDRIEEDDFRCPILPNT
jgi:hypothetical protein